MIPSFEFKRLARMVLKPILQTIALIALIAMLPSVISDTVTLLTEADPMSFLMDEFSEMTTRLSDETLTGDALAAEAEAATAAFWANCRTFLQEKGLILLCTSLLVLLLSPVLKLGLYHAILRAVRKQEADVPLAFSRFGVFLKAIGLDVMLMLRLVLWGLPGYAVMMLAVFIPVPFLNDLLLTGGMLLMLVMVLRAFYRYELARYIMADHPETGVNEAIRQSSGAMQRRKMELFLLDFSFLFWTMLASFLSDLFPPVIGLTLYLLASLLILVYKQTARVLFYELYVVRGITSPRQSSPDSAPSDSDDLN